VEGGGSLLATGLTSLFDEDGRRRENFALADVFGVDFKSMPLWSFAYIYAKDKLQEGSLRHPFRVDQGPVETVLRAGKALALCAYPEAEKTEATTVLWGSPPPDESTLHPVIALNRFGRGRCVYAGFTPGSKGQGNASSKQLALSLVEMLLPGKVLQTNAPPGVEVVLNTGGGRHVLHLVNHLAGAENALSRGGRRLVLDGVKVSIDTHRIGPFQKVYAAPSGKTVRHRMADAVLEISVPPFETHSLVVLE